MIQQIDGKVRDLAEGLSLLDDVDKRILNLLAERAAVCHALARYKLTRGLIAFKEVRNCDLVASRRAWATRMGLDPDIVGVMFSLLCLAGEQAQRSVLQAGLPIFEDGDRSDALNQWQENFRSWLESHAPTNSGKDEKAPSALVQPAPSSEQLHMVVAEDTLCDKATRL